MAVTLDPRFTGQTEAELAEELRAWQAGVDAAMARVKAKAWMEKYSEDQERDEQGRFSGGGGGFGALPDKMLYGREYNRELTDAIVGKYGDYGDRLSLEEKLTFSDYADDSTWINKSLRDPVGAAPYTNEAPEVKEQVDRMTSALDKASAPEEITAYRGLWGRADDLPEGSEFIDHGFVSTSLSMHQAAIFGYGELERDEDGHLTSVHHIARIHFPEGSKVAPINASNLVSRREAEVVAQRESTYRVVKIHDAKEIKVEPTSPGSMQITSSPDVKPSVVFKIVDIEMVP